MQFGVAQHPAAIPAAAADKAGVLGVAGLQHQPFTVGGLQDLQDFLFADVAAAVVADVEIRSPTHRKACLQRLAAAFVEQVFLLPAYARRDCEAVVGFQHLLGAFVGQHFGRRFQAGPNRDGANWGAFCQVCGLKAILRYSPIISANS